MPLKAIIFDVDGTLAETEEYHRRAFNQAFSLHGYDWFWDEARYRELLQVTGGKERILAYATQVWPERLAEVHALVPQIHRIKTACFTRWVKEGKVPLRPGIETLIGDARAAGLRLAIATTTSIENVEALLGAAMGPAWRSIFFCVAAGDMVPEKKPAPDVYQLALRQLGLPPQACIALEDSRNGILSARSAGIRVIAIKSKYCGSDDLSGASRILSDPAELELRLLSEG